MTGASYNTTTLLAVITFNTITAYPPVGSWVTIASITPSGYNGSFLVTASGTTSITVQNYTGTTLTYSSGGTITINSAGTAGLTFGDTTTKATNKAPIVTYIATSSAITGTPLAVANTYTTPIGTKYLKVRMVGAGGGGSNWSVPGAAGGIGGNTTFTGSGTQLVAYGGSTQPNYGMSYYGSSTYPYTYWTGGAGGGSFYVASYVSNGGNSYTLTLCSLTSAIGPQLVTTNNYLTGTTMTLFGFQTVINRNDLNWNRIVTITSYTATTVTFTAVTTLSAPVTYGLIILNNTNTTTYVSPGQAGFPSSNIGNGAPAPGGVSMLGYGTPFYAMGVNNTLDIPNYPVTCPSGSPFYGGGGAGGGNVVTSGSNGGGNGGGAGQYIETYISAPATSYTYTLGAGGQGGAGDGYRNNCGTGGNGFIIVEAYF